MYIIVQGRVYELNVFAKSKNDLKNRFLYYYSIYKMIIQILFVVSNKKIISSIWRSLTRYTSYGVF